MPTAQTMFVDLNALFSPANIDNLEPAWFNGSLTEPALASLTGAVANETVPGDTTFIGGLGTGSVTLGQLARALSVAKNQFHQDFIDSIPEGMRQCLTALIRHDLSRNPRLPITWSWAPGYDYELTVWECPGTSVSPGGITVLLKTRYPLDGHPKDL